MADETIDGLKAELRKTNALAGRVLAREQAQATTLYNLREAISQALSCLRREHYAEATQILRDALDDNR